MVAQPTKSMWGVASCGWPLGSQGEIWRSGKTVMPAPGRVCRTRCWASGRGFRSRHGAHCMHGCITRNAVLLALALVIVPNGLRAGGEDYRAEPRRGRRAELVRIAPGTLVGDQPPKMWSHLVIKSLPRLASGELETLSRSAFRTAPSSGPGGPRGLLPWGSHGSVRALSGIRLVTS